MGLDESKSLVLWNGILGMVSLFLCVSAVIYGSQLFKYMKSLAILIGI